MGWALACPSAVLHCYRRIPASRQRRRTARQGARTSQSQRLNHKGPGGRVSYLGELRNNVRPLLGASLGIGTSLPLFAYTNSAFAPFLIEEFGWSRAQFALIGLTMFAALPFFPVIGRLTDRFGVRRVALA